MSLLEGMGLSNNQKSKMAQLDAATTDTIKAIMLALRFSEKDVVLDNIRDIVFNKQAFVRPLYIDLSVDRSTTPLEVSFTGNYLSAFTASDDAANCNIAYEYAEADTTKRFNFVRGRRKRVGYTKLYIYHAAQAGKYMLFTMGLGLPSAPVGDEDDSSTTTLTALVTSLGNSSAFTTNQISVTTSATVIKAANTSRQRITITNASGSTIYIGGSGVTTGNGHALLAGCSITLNTTAAVYGISAAGTLTATYLEE